jgi:hypothetical protein
MNLFKIYAHKRIIYLISSGNMLEWWIMIKMNDCDQQELGKNTQILSFPAYK